MLKKFLVTLMLATALLFAAPAMAEEDENLVILPDSPSHFLNYEQGGQLSRLSFITPTRVYMKVFSGISVADYINMYSDLVKIRDYTEIRDVTIMINSPGGSAFDGLSIADLLIRAQDDWGFNISAEASGIVASAAVPIFAVCDNRMASPGTLFMVHETALWKWPGRETASDIHSQSALMKKLQKKYVGYMVANSNLSAKEWGAMEKVTTWFTAEQACEYGLIDVNCKGAVYDFNTIPGHH
jgi:ATP-dependent protease ClpP protease subunit